MNTGEGKVEGWGGIFWFSPISFHCIYHEIFDEEKGKAQYSHQ